MILGKTIIFVGVSGVGKTTFLRVASSHLSFQHLSAGTLIAQARLSTDRGRDALRLADLDENQRLLVSGFDLHRDPGAKLVVLDGHVVIHGSRGLQPLGSTVFSSLGANAFVHMVADPAFIAENRLRDSERTRPLLSLAEIADHQGKSIDVATCLANSLAIPIKLIAPADMDEFCAFAADLC